MTREEALSILKTFRITGDKAHEAFDMAIKALEQEPGWIPVSEGLPEPWASVLITFSGQHGGLTAIHAVGGGSYDGSNGWYFEDIGGYAKRLTVEAWQPLPEPYKGSEG